MAIDEERYRQYRKEMQSLQGDLSFAEYQRTARAKLLDLFAKGELDPENTPRLRRIVRSIFGDEVARFTDDIVEKYDQTLDVVNELYDDLGVDVERDWQRIRAVEEATRQELGKYETSTVRSINQAVRAATTQSEGVDGLKKRLDGVGGRAAFYADTIAKTQVKTVSRAAKAEKSRIADVRLLQYVGIIRDTTRPFCRAMLDVTLNLDTIRKLRNGNREPVLLNCGGWNCIHDWEPDPFASEPDSTDLFELRQGVRLAGGPQVKQTYQTALAA